MKRIPTGIAILCGTLSLTWALDASAARSIRTEQGGGNGWVACGAASTTSTACSVLLPPGLELNPDGTTPEPESFFTNNWTTYDGGAAPVTEGADEDLQPWVPNADGVEPATQGLTIDNNTIPVDYQAMYFNLSGGDAAGLFGGDGGNTEGLKLYCASDMVISGTSTACPSNQIITNSIGDDTVAWEVEFNYNTIPSGGASFEFDGITYTASQSVLADSSDSNAFVFYNSELYCPAEWTSCSASTSGSAPEPGAAGALSAGAVAWLAWFGGRKMSRRRRPRTSIS